MRIIQVTHGYPPNIGGVQNCTRQISEELARTGHEVEVFSPDLDSEKGRLKSRKSLRIHYLKSLEVAHTPLIPSLLPRLMKIPKNSIIHVHIAKAFVPEIVFLVSKIRKIPYVAHFHLDVDPSGKFGFLLPLYKRFILKSVLKSASKIVVLTDQYKDFINKKYSILENVIVIPNGVDEKFFLKKKSISSKNNKLLFVGRLSVQKNVQKLINAVALIKNKATLHIVGEGELKPQIRNTISDKKLKNVILHGKKTGKELVDLYRSALIFLLASEKEGSPLVLLEAMAAGVPIIASDVIGNHEFVSDVGILVNPPTPENFAKVIDKIIENKKLGDRLTEKGRKKAKQYSWDKTVEKFESVYEEVLRENKQK